MKRRGEESYEDQVADLLGEPRPKLKERAPHLKQAVCAWVAQGKTLNSWCEQPGTPTSLTIHNWLDQDPAFAEEYRKARVVGWEVLIDQCLDIADSATEVTVKSAALKIQTRLKLLARWDSARYGDKIRVETKALDDSSTMKEVMRLLALAKTRQLRDPANRLSPPSDN